MAGVSDPESVAEHSWRTALIASVIAKLEGADPARAAFLAVWHDTQETRTGDVNHLGKKYSTTADPAAVTADQTAGMPELLASAIQGLIAEYEAKMSCSGRGRWTGCAQPSVSRADRGRRPARRRDPDRVWGPSRSGGVGDP
ncbi:HD domain-containing protein [Streptomyces sp. NPDC003042]